MSKNNSWFPTINKPLLFLIFHICRWHHNLPNYSGQNLSGLWMFAFPDKQLWIHQQIILSSNFKIYPNLVTSCQTHFDHSFLSRQHLFSPLIQWPPRWSSCFHCCSLHNLVLIYYWEESSKKINMIMSLTSFKPANDFLPHLGQNLEMLPWSLFWICIFDIPLSLWSGLMPLTPMPLFSINRALVIPSTHNLLSVSKPLQLIFSQPRILLPQIFTRLTPSYRSSLH